jgi:glycogen operon protein
MTRRDWQGGECLLGMFLNGKEIVNRGPHGEEIEDDSFVLLFNPLGEDRTVMLPRRRFGAQWALELATADAAADPGSTTYGARTEVPIPSHAIVVLKRVA